MYAVEHTLLANMYSAACAVHHCLCINTVHCTNAPLQYVASLYCRLHRLCLPTCKHLCAQGLSNVKADHKLLASLVALWGQNILVCMWWLV